MSSVFEKLLYLAYHLGFPQPDDESKVNIDELESFIDKELHKRFAPDDYYNQTMQLRKIFGLNSAMYGQPLSQPRINKTSSSKPCKCSNCGKSEHTKSSCPKNKKGKKKKTNYVQDSSSSSSNSSSESDSSSDSDSDSSGHICYGLKKKDASKVANKKSDGKKTQVNRNLIISEVFRLILKSMVESFVKSVPKDTVISVFHAIDAEFAKLKEPILSQLKGSPSIKAREKIWGSVNDIFISILGPMISILASDMASNLIHRDDESLCIDDNL